jgi:hypothetical protein
MNDTDKYPYYVDVDAQQTAHIYTDVRTMQNLLDELMTLREQVVRLQTGGTELVEENRTLKRKLKKYIDLGELYRYYTEDNIELLVKPYSISLNSIMCEIVWCSHDPPKEKFFDPPKGFHVGQTIRYTGDTDEWSKEDEKKNS